MFKPLLVAALLGLGATAPAAAHIIYTVTRIPSGPESPSVLLAQVSVSDFITQNTQVTPPDLEYCQYTSYKCHALQFFPDSEGLSAYPYAALGFKYIGGTSYMYFEPNAFSTPGSYIGIWGDAQLTVTQVPEPATFALMAVAAPALLLRRRRRPQ